MLHRTAKTTAMVTVLALCLGLRGGETARLPQEEQTPDVVYVGTPYDVVATMLEMAGVTKDDVVWDLGCGDGRVVVLAAQKYGCRGVGYDIDPERVGAARANAKKHGVEHLVEIVQADLFTLDLSDADVLLLYLLPEINERLIPQFEKLEPGARIVSHDYGLEGITAQQTASVVSNEDNASHSIFLYIAPLQQEMAARRVER